MSKSVNFVPDPPVRCREFRIGAVGAGMIMAECHLAAYREAGFKVAAIASRTKAHADKVAARWAIPKVHATPEALIEDPEIEILDLAYPPDQQPALIRLALKQKHIKGILAQKPLALSLDEAIRLRDEAAAAGKPVSVNQNMRYDQSMRVLKQILDRGELGEVVFAQIDMHAIPHWQTFLEGYDRLTLANMSVHHLDVLRYPARRSGLRSPRRRAKTRAPRFDHSDGITRFDHDLPVRRDGAVARGRLVGAAPGGLQGRPAYHLARRGHRRRRQGNDRLADGRGVDADLRLEPDDRRRVGVPGLVDDVVPPRFHRRDGAAAVRGQDRERRRHCPSPTT